MATDLLEVSDDEDGDDAGFPGNGERIDGRGRRGELRRPA
jgi:hypothetical protein